MMHFKPLIPLLPWGCPLESLHCCYIGVLKRLLSLIKDPDATTRSPLMTGDDLKRFDELIADVKWPSEVHWKINETTIEDAAHWKGQQFRCFIYVVPLLLAICDNDVLVMLAAYSSALLILDGDYVNEEMIAIAKDLLIAAHKAWRKLFGKKEMVYNLHAHLHLADQVRALGPLSAASAFAFESHLNSLGSLKGSAGRGYVRLICERYTQRSVLLKSKYNDEVMCWFAACILFFVDISWLKLYEC